MAREIAPGEAQMADMTSVDVFDDYKHDYEILNAIPVENFEFNFENSSRRNTITEKTSKTKEDCSNEFINVINEKGEEEKPFIIEELLLNEEMDYVKLMEKVEKKSNVKAWMAIQSDIAHTNYWLQFVLDSGASKHLCGDLEFIY